MRTIKLSETGVELVKLIKEDHPIDEDIGILDSDGAVCGVVITKDAYDFFLKKVEEEEDRIDEQTIREFRQSGESDS